MVLMYWWLLIPWALLFVVLFVLFRIGSVRRRPAKQQLVKVAHTQRITRLPEYLARNKAYRRWLWVVLIVGLLGVLSAVILSSRPARQNLVTPAQTNRDIVLCLDVSGSMTNVDIELVKTFEQLVNEFAGQRIGLDIFNFNNSQVVPVTDDYTLVKEQLAYAKKMLAIDPFSSDLDVTSERTIFLAGTQSFSITTSDGRSFFSPSSNVGVGLAGCAQHLGENLSGRSQSIVLATDNELGGIEENAMISTKQAMMLAKQKGIRVYALDPGVYDQEANKSSAGTADNYSGEHAVLKSYALTTGGAYYRLSSVDVVPDIITKVSEQEAKLFVGDAQYAATDTPLPGFIILFISVVSLSVITWRIQL